MTEITHERCSELLAGHHRGELGAEDASAVERHLAGCEECRAELAGLRALSRSTEFEPLGDDERERLRDAVAREARLAPGQVYELPARRSLWERHAGQIVGAAASIVVLLFAVLVVWGGLQGGDDSARDGAESESGGGDAATADQEVEPATGRPQPLFGISSNLRALGAQDDAEEADESPSALQRLETRSKHSERSIERLGESGSIFRAFSEAYTTDDAGLADELLNQLASGAPDAELRDQVLECGASLLGDDPERPLLPAFATVADYNGQDALILGFVTSDGFTTELGHYSIWGWALPADCGQILFGTGGAIGPGP